ncbi:MAG: hypothetical protein N2C14_21135 [Planctomycetales bacterium]
MRGISSTHLTIGLTYGVLLFSSTPVMAIGLLEEAVSRSKQTGLPIMMVASGGCGT